MAYIFFLFQISLKTFRQSTVVYSCCVSIFILLSSSYILIRFSGGYFLLLLFLTKSIKCLFIVSYEYEREEMEAA